MIAINCLENTTLCLKNDITQRFEHYSLSGVKVNSLLHLMKRNARNLV